MTTEEIEESEWADNELVKLQKQLESWRKAASPVTDNPDRGCVLRKSRGINPEMNQFILEQEYDWPKLSMAQPIPDGPTKAGCWRATGPLGSRLIIVAHDEETGEWMARLSDAIHEYPPWFKPDLSVWVDWEFIT